MNKKNLLYITTRLPYPPHSGNKVKSFNVIKILHRYFDIDFVTISDENDPSEETLDFLRNHTSNFKIFNKSRINCYLNALKIFINDKPIQTNYYYFKDVQSYINNRIRQAELVIVSNLVRTPDYVRKQSSIPIFWDAIDSLSISYQRALPNLRSIFWRIIYTIEIKRIEKFERYYIQRFNTTLLVNKDESDFWSKIGNVNYLPNGVDDSLLQPENIDEKYKNCVCFFGKMDYQPNIDAVLWFTENVLGLLPNEIRFLIIGISPSSKIVKLKRKKNIEVLGFVKDPYLIIRSCICSVAPMQTGGGIQNKVLESMASKGLVIASKLAGKAIDKGQNGIHLIIQDDPEIIAKEISSFWKNSSKSDQIRENARNLIREYYSWKRYEDELIQIING
jgi:glycosyltransferase involved in cell wall biosynthesis